MKGPFILLTIAVSLIGLSASIHMWKSNDRLTRIEALIENLDYLPSPEE